MGHRWTQVGRAVGWSAKLVSFFAVSTALILASVIGGLVGGSLASASTHPSCTLTPASTSTCNLSLRLVSGSFAVHGNTPVTPFTKTPTFTKPIMTGLTGVENPSSGAISSGTLTLLPKNEVNRGSTETIIFRQVSAGTTTGTIATNGQLALNAQLQILITIKEPIQTACLSTPITVALKSATAYSSTTDNVTVSASTFTVPDFVSTPTYPCTEALNTLNKTFPGSVGNELTLQLHGPLLAPPKPTVASVTTLMVSPKHPATTGGTLPGQPATMTASVVPSGSRGVSGSVQFMATTVDIGSPVALVQGATATTAALTTTSLPPGISHLKAIYNGNGTYLQSTSAVVNYQVLTAPTVNIALPTKVTVAGPSSPTEFSGVIVDPAVNGPTLPHVRLTFNFSGVEFTAAANVHLSVCTTPSYITCTSVALTGRSPVIGHYGGHGTNTISLKPGTQIPVYFKLAFTQTAAYGRLKFTVNLVSTTAGGTTPNVTVASQAGTIVMTVGAKQSATIFIGMTTAGTHQTRQGYNASFNTILTETTTFAPSPTGTVTYYRSPVTTPSTVLPIGSTAVGSSHLRVNITAKNWPATKKYKITASYSGDTFYLPSTDVIDSVTLTVAPPTGGTAYTCVNGTTNVPTFVTSVGGGDLPPSAAVGATVPVSGLKVTAYVDASGLGTTAGVASLTAGFSPEGGGTGTPAEVNPFGVAIDSKTHTAYVSVLGSGNVLAINEQTNTQEAVIPVGSTPEGLAVDPGAGTTGMVYVANQGSGSLSVINAATNTVVKTITVGTKPSRVAVDPKLNTVYVTNSGSNSVSVVADTVVSATITTLIGTDPVSLALDPTLGALYVTYRTTKTPTRKKLTTINIQTNAVTGAYTGLAATTARGTMVVDPKTQKVYVAGGTRVVVLKENGTSGPTATRTISGFSSGSNKGIAIDPTAATGGEIYLAAAASSTTAYAFVGTASAASGATKITVGKTSQGVAVDPALGANGTIYIVNPYEGQLINKVSGTTKAVVGTIETTAGAVNDVFNGVSKPLTKQLNFTVNGAVEMTTTGTVAVGLSSFTFVIQTRLTSSRFVCTPVTRAAAIGTVNSLPLSKPAITAEPASTTVAVGSPAVFSAGASGVTTPTVQWQSSPNGGSIWSTIVGATSTTYTTPATSGSDNGLQYRAVFTNANGSATSTAVTLTVDVPPTVTGQPNSQIVTAGTTATFSATATSRPAPGVQWQVSTDGGSTWTDIPAATSDTLTVSSTKKDDGNLYRAVFTNLLGKATSTTAVLLVTTGGYRLVGSDGAVYSFGNAKFDGSMGGQPLNKPVVGMASTPTGGGYWLVASDGGIFAFGNAPFYGSGAGGSGASSVVGIDPTYDGSGYWLTTAAGSVIPFGDAPLAGSMAGLPLNAPIVGISD